MDRRSGGLLIVLLVLLAAVVAPSVTGRVVAGHPVIGPIPGPPRVGDCVLQPPTVTDGSVDDEGEAIYLPLTASPCAGFRFGEVVAVLPDGMSTRAVRSADDDGVLSFDDPNRHRCTTAMADYLRPGRSTDVWNPAIVFASAPARPTDLQLRMGQRWVACVLYAVGADAKVVRYPGTVRDGAISGPLSATAAECLNSADYFVQHAVDCAEPHRVEAFAMVLTNDPRTTQQSLDNRCRSVVRASTAMADPTAGSQMIETAAAVHRASDGTQAPGLSTADETGTALCLLTARSRELSGSLLGLGARPVPWTQY